MFENLTTQGLEKQEDRLGGGKFGTKETDIYHGVVQLFYAGKAAQSAAQNVTLVVALDDGSEYRETIWVTNKNGVNWFADKQDANKKIPLPGFSLANNIALLTAEKELPALEWEEKVVKLYDFEQKKELPTAVMNAPEVCGQRIALAIVKELVNKEAKDANGQYQPTAEEREQNVIEKAFHEETMLTVTEALEQGLEQGEFHAKWLEKNKGKTRDKRKIKDGQAGTAGKPALPGKPAPTASAGAPAASGPKKLFGNKG